MISAVLLGFQAASSSPIDRFMLTVGGDPATMMSFNWRVKIPGPIDLELRLPNRETLKFRGRRQAAPAPGPRDEYQTIQISKLKPDTSYQYRLTSANWAGPWKTFRTFPQASPTFGPWTFLYMGDAQANILRSCGPLFRQAMKTSPDARLVLHGGDQIDNNGRESEWDEWFQASSAFADTVPSAATPGNHEYGKPGKFKGVLSPSWNAQFDFPKNGPVPETAYYFDAGGVRFVSFDSMTKVDEQYVWLDKVMAEPGPKWRVLLTHYPILVTMKGQEKPGWEKKIREIADRRRIDLVLTGHLHSYARSRLVTAKSTSSQLGGTLYMVATAGNKFYRQDSFPWIAKGMARTQTFTSFSVSPTTLSGVTYGLKGEVLDQFRLERQPSGLNRLR